VACLESIFVLDTSFISQYLGFTYSLLYIHTHTTGEIPSKTLSPIFVSADRTSWKKREEFFLGYSL